MEHKITEEIKELLDEVIEGLSEENPPETELVECIGPFVNSLNTQELLSEGILQEVNRLFFHPLGLALDVSTERVTGGENEDEIFVAAHITDHRSDPEGVTFEPGIIDSEMIRKVVALRNSKIAVRSQLPECNKQGIQRY